MECSVFQNPFQLRRSSSQLSILTGTPHPSTHVTTAAARSATMPSGHYPQSLEQHIPSTQPSMDGKTSPGGLKPLLLPTAFSPQLPSTPELGPFTHHHHYHYPRKSSAPSPSWVRQSSFSASIAPASSCCPSRQSHYRQTSVSSSSNWPSSSSSSSSSVSSASSISSYHNPTLDCLQESSHTPQPGRSTRSLSANYATHHVLPGSSVIRTSSLSHPLTPINPPEPATRRAIHSKRSSISYSKFSPPSFLPPPSISAASTAYSSEPVVFSANPIEATSNTPTEADTPQSASPLLDPSQPESIDKLLDELLVELVQCAHSLGLQDELVGIVEL